MEIQVKFKCKPNVLEIYSYIMYYSFSGTAGAVRIGISILFLAIAWYTAGEVETILTLLLVLVGLLNPAVTPVCLYLRAVKMEKTETEIQYEIDEEKVLVCQNGVRRKLPFAVFPQIVWGKRCLLLYVDGSHAPADSKTSDEWRRRQASGDITPSSKLRAGKNKRQEAGLKKGVTTQI